MIKGIEIFRDAFSGFADSYILIGGAACDIQLEQAGVPFRVTRDLDVVLCVESLTPEFGRAFWRFIREGGYQIQQRAMGEKKFYRFRDPATPDYPFMLELFSRDPLNFEIARNSVLTPIPMEEEVSSLSAILLNDEYYRFIRAHKTRADSVSLLSGEALIVLKAKAWLDLSARKNAGEPIDSKDIKKHKNDVFRLFVSLPGDAAVALPPEIEQDMRLFLSRIQDEEIDLKALRIKGRKAEILAGLHRLFGI